MSAVHEEAQLDGSRMTLAEHLEELRMRLIRSAIAVVVALGLGWAIHTEIASVVLWPYERAVVRLERDLAALYNEKIAADDELTWEDYFTSPDPEDRQLLLQYRIPPLMRGDAASTGFFFYMRVCFYFALFVAGPFVLWQIWQFIAAGLYKHEQRVINTYFPFSVGLFLGGVLFGYFMMVPYALYFLARMSLGQIAYWESLDNYFSFLTSLTLALGAVFQLPLLMLAVARVGMVEPKDFARYRGHFIIGALVLAALLTPPDPFTQLLMAIPMIALYELGHVLARYTTRPPVKELALPGE